jgi:hypothetical protein
MSPQRCLVGYHCNIEEREQEQGKPISRQWLSIQVRTVWLAEDTWNEYLASVEQSTRDNESVE